MIVIRRKLLLQESSHVTSLLSAGGLGLLVILSLECERLLLLLKGKINKTNLVMKLKDLNLNALAI